MNPHKITLAQGASDAEIKEALDFAGIVALGGWDVQVCFILRSRFVRITFGRYDGRYLQTENFSCLDWAYEHVDRPNYASVDAATDGASIKIEIN